MSTALVIAGIALAAGGLIYVAMAYRQYRTGSSWRSMALIGSANILYGGIVLAGLTRRASWFGTTLVWLIAIAIWGAVLLMRRERSRAVGPR